MSTIEVKVPDIGGATDVEIIELSVAPGDTVAVDDPLIVLESDKASMEVPSPYAGKVVSFKVKVGDTVSEGDLILEMDAEGGDAGDESPAAASEPAAEESVEDEASKRPRRWSRRPPRRPPGRASRRSRCPILAVPRMCR